MRPVETSARSRSTPTPRSLQPQAARRRKATAASSAARMTSAFQGVAMQGKSLGDVFQSLALSLSQMALQAAFKPLEQVGRLSRSSAGSCSPAACRRPAGAVRGRRRDLEPDRVPLQRRHDRHRRRARRARRSCRWRAARRPASACKRAAARGVAVTFNVTTPDADSFRRSETQLAAMLARAVGAGPAESCEL